MFVYLLRRDSLIANYMYISTCIYLKIFQVRMKSLMLDVQLRYPLIFDPARELPAISGIMGMMAGSCCKPVEFPNVSLSESSSTCVLIGLYFLKKLYENWISFRLNKT